MVKCAGSHGKEVAQNVMEVIGDYNGEGFHTEQQHVGLYFLNHLTSWYWW